MNQSVVTVVGKDRIGIVYDIAKLLADEKINILNIKQQLLDDYFTMILLVDTSQCTKSYKDLTQYCTEKGQALGLDVKLQHTEILNAMHRI